jgi:merlin
MMMDDNDLMMMCVLVSRSYERHVPGNHELYMRRRKADSLEVQQMRAQANEARKRKEAERKKLLLEKQKRDEAERKQKELETRMREAEAQRLAMEEALRRTERTAEILAERVTQVEEEAAEMTVKVSATRDRVC